MSFISKTPGVMGGRACIRNTRIAVWILVDARQSGATDAQLRGDYPGLAQDDLAAAWDYFVQNRQEILSDIQANALDQDRN